VSELLIEVRRRFQRSAAFSGPSFFGECCNGWRLFRFDRGFEFFGGNHWRRGLRLLAAALKGRQPKIGATHCMISFPWIRPNSWLFIAAASSTSIRKAAPILTRPICATLVHRTGEGMADGEKRNACKTSRAHLSISHLFRSMDIR